ncbi:MAG: MazG nucleotide pyrophosphohydrolase domain-containing protein [archaeon]|nr:MazG nucleotide pyrophosphohydrolase domain-containing protein [archaeon]
MGYLTVKDMQKQVDDWIQKNGGYWEPLSILGQCQEELGELARVVNNLYGGRRKKLGDPEGEIGSETSDLMFALVCLLNYHHIDLESAWIKTIDARCERDKTRYK